MVSSLTSAQRFDAVTTICIVESRVPPFEVFHALSSSLTYAAKDHEIVLVANGVSAEVTHQLGRIAHLRCCSESIRPWEIGCWY